MNFARLARAIEFYKSLGYTYVDVPWRVPNRVVLLTSPDVTKQDISGKDGLTLVASAEQSFIYLMEEGLTEPGRYVACTPCFRDDEPDSTHVPYFMKVELVHVGDASEEAVADIKRSAEMFFKSEGASPVRFENDLEINGIEVGSYNVSPVPMPLACGTGLAEPRFSIAIKGLL